MNDQISAKFEINPSLSTIQAILLRSYDGLPIHLKSAFLYLSIFREGQIIRWGRLVRQWIAEGYSRDIRGLTAIKVSQCFFDDGYRNRGCSNVKGEDDIVEKYSGYIDRISTCQTCSVLLFRGHLFLRPQILDGVILPRGIGELKTLHTLGFVDASRSNGKAILKELRQLTQLRKLRVVGISYKNSTEFWWAIACHYELQSLAVHGKRLDSEGSPLNDCLGEDLMPPRSLESLSLVGKLANATKWIDRLQNLSKLVLTSSALEQDDDAIQGLGSLPNLAVLRLMVGSFAGTQLHFQRFSFWSLMVLQVHGLLELQSVLFEEKTMAKLQLLQVGQCISLGRDTELNAFFGLPALTSLKVIRLAGLDESVKEEVQMQVAEHVRVIID